MQAALMPPLMLRLEGSHPAVLSYVSQHKWLGFAWRVDGNWLPCAKARLAAAAATLATLTGLVQTGVLPLALAVVLFESKVSSD